MTTWFVICRDCGWRKKVTDEEWRTGVNAERSAKASKAGHMGGGQKYRRKSDPCEDVIVTDHPQLEDLLVDESEIET